MRRSASRPPAAPAAALLAALSALSAPLLAALSALSAALLLAPCAAWAHYGPPFPILTDCPAGPYLAAVWADPNIGSSQFFVLLNARKGGPPLPPPSEVHVRIGVRPISKRLPEAVYTLVPQPQKGGVRYYTGLEFDRGEHFTVRVEIEGPGFATTLHSDVEATPAGVLGPIGLLVYGFPFAGMGYIWVRATLRRRRPPAPLPAPGHPDRTPPR